MVDPVHLKKIGVNTTSECFERVDEKNSSIIDTLTNYTHTTNDVPPSLSLERLLLDFLSVIFFSLFSFFHS